MAEVAGSSAESKIIVQTPDPKNESRLSLSVNSVYGREGLRWEVVEATAVEGK